VRKTVKYLTLLFRQIKNLDHDDDDEAPALLPNWIPANFWQSFAVSVQIPLPLTGESKRSNPNPRKRWKYNPATATGATKTDFYTRIEYECTENKSGWDEDLSSGYTAFVQ
jgi:hypothetical protein